MNKLQAFKMPQYIKSKLQALDEHNNVFIKIIDPNFSRSKSK